MGKKVTAEHNLAVCRPDLAKQWHPTKNGDLTPYDVAPGSSKKIWWMCERQHEWRVTPNNRIASHTGYPYCSGRRASVDHCLATDFPDLVEEWNVEKNVALTPFDVTPSSAKKVWWRCPLGHEWCDTVAHRTHDLRGCSVCNSGTQTSFPEQVIYYYISKVFDDAVNRHKVVADDKSYEIDIYIPSIRVGIEYDGYTHVDLIESDIEKSRALQSQGIHLIRVRQHDLPLMVSDYCYVIRRDSRSVQDLTECISLIVDYILENCTLSIKDVNKLNVLRTIEIENDRDEIYSRVYTRRVEDSFASKHPDLLDEWDYDKNANLNPYSLFPQSNVTVWWVCKNGHSYDSLLSDRVAHHSGCPYCSHRRVSIDNCLANVDPLLAKEWHPTKNGEMTAFDITSKSNKKVWWLCSNGHEMFRSPNNRSVSRKCPYCSKRSASVEYNLITEYPHVAGEWNYDKNGELSPEDVTPKSRERVWWVCRKCSCEWKAQICNRANGSKCPRCRS